MKRILLVTPRPPSLGYQYSRILELRLLQVRAPFVPLHLATIAALTPDDIEVDLWDEQVHGWIEEATDFSKNYDLVGITGYSSHARRAKEIARVFRQRGIIVAIGGVGISATPERYYDAADVLFLGEAELTWPRFIADWKSGNQRRVYRQVTKPDLAISPVPCWDSIAGHMHHYLLGAVQTTRGCPFDCEFCDVVSLFGHRPRYKPIDRVLEEVATLARLGMERVFFNDDNFIGDPRYAKEMLRELISLNNSLRRPILFSTQLTINVAKDEKLLELLADANFGTLFIGIETPNKESLKETNKLLNVRSDLIEDCNRIQSYGMAIRAGMIVGFDHDDSGIFDQQYEFLQEVGIPVPSISILKAIPGTKLWSRLQREERLVKTDTGGHLAESLATTNIVPQRMTFDELLTGYVGLVDRLTDWRNFEERITRMVSGIRRKPNISKRKRQWKRLFQAARFLLSLHKDARRSIFRIIMHTRRQAPFMMDKVFGLIIQHYGHAGLASFLHEDARKQIELSKSGKFRPVIDNAQTMIPKAFKGAYQEIFPEIHQQVYLGLNDKRRTEETLVAIFVDFIKCQEEELNSFTEHHKVILNEFVENSMARENRLISPLTALDDQAAPDIKKARLAEEIFKAVEQELRLTSGIQH